MKNKWEKEAWKGPNFKKMFDTVWSTVDWSTRLLGVSTSGLYYKRVTIVIDAPSVVKVTLQIVASLTIVTRL